MLIVLHCVDVICETKSSPFLRSSDKDKHEDQLLKRYQGISDVLMLTNFSKKLNISHRSGCA